MTPGDIIGAIFGLTILVCVLSVVIVWTICFCRWMWREFK